ncbi:hypothetical protein Pfo_027502 [Paulownia fortunei]|nr:hypothetical protein Pfo_027502 [Paulownia fortunei]
MSFLYPPSSLFITISIIPIRCIPSLSTYIQHLCIYTHKVGSLKPTIFAIFLDFGLTVDLNQEFLIDYLSFYELHISCKESI